MNSRVLDTFLSALIQKDIEKNKYDTNTLSHRLKLCLKLYSMSQSDLARLIGVKPQIIQYLCTKNIKSSKFTFELAEALGVDYTWLSTGEGVMREARDPREIEQKIPLFAWNELDQILDANSLNSHNREFVFSPISPNYHMIATRIDDASMEPRFERDTITIFELSDESSHGDFVLVKLNQANRWVFRELRCAKQYRELLPVNNSIFKEIILQPEDKIMGILVRTIYDFKRERI